MLCSACTCPGQAHMLMRWIGQTTLHCCSQGAAGANRQQQPGSNHQRHPLAATARHAQINNAGTASHLLGTCAACQSSKCVSLMMVCDGRVVRPNNEGMERAPVVAPLHRSKLKTSPPPPHKLQYLHHKHTFHPGSDAHKEKLARRLLMPVVAACRYAPFRPSRTRLIPKQPAAPLMLLLLPSHTALTPPLRSPPAANKGALLPQQHTLTPHHEAASCATAAAAITNWPTQKLLVLFGPKWAGARPTGWQFPTVPSGCSDTVVRQAQAFSTTGR